MSLSVRKELLARGDGQCALASDARQLDRPSCNQRTRDADRTENDLLPIRRVVAAVTVVGIAVREASAHGSVVGHPQGSMGDAHVRQ